MEIHEIRPGMTCLTREGTAYVLEVDRQSLLVLLQRRMRPSRYRCAAMTFWDPLPATREGT